MRFFNSTEAAKNLGAISQIVQSEPVCIQSHGRPPMVMLSQSEYVRLRQQDRRVCSTHELPVSVRTMIEAAQPPALAASFNDEVK
jgi:PHD/YefM family antitoxin component YafN of YafNO toxin-antitoxin module